MTDKPDLSPLQGILKHFGGMKYHEHGLPPHVVEFFDLLVSWDRIHHHLEAAFIEPSRLSPEDHLKQYQRDNDFMLKKASDQFRYISRHIINFDK